MDGIPIEGERKRIGDDVVMESVIDTGPDDQLVIEELLVEEISIDGMCGVY